MSDFRFTVHEFSSSSQPVETSDFDPSASTRAVHNMDYRHVNAHDQHASGGADGDIDDEDQVLPHQRHGTGITTPTSLGRPRSENDLELADGVKERQEAINLSHPFGMRLWKPSLYKKSRTIEKMTELALHENPTVSHPFELASFGNVLWSVLFGSWISLIYLAATLLYIVISTPALLFGSISSSQKVWEYVSLLFGMAWYMLWPFGKYISRRRGYYDDISGSASVNVSSPHGSDPYGYFDPRESPEREPFLTDGTPNREDSSNLVVPPDVDSTRGDLSMNNGILGLQYGDVTFYGIYGALLAPLHVFVALLNFLMVVSVPMAKLNNKILKNLRHDPTSLEISHPAGSVPHGEIVLCTYSAFGLQYLKYTYDGINIIFLNLLVFVALALFDGYVIRHAAPDSFFALPTVVFMLCLISVIPLAYFIGMAVASISSQSSLGLGAVINATFGSIVEIILYALMIKEENGILVEGSIIGSILACLLLLPGLSMIAGGVGKWKEQRFNVKSAGVSTVLLIMALIGAFTPTIFYSVYGEYNLVCKSCPDTSNGSELTEAMMTKHCSGCRLIHPRDMSSDPFFTDSLKPLMYWCAAILPSAYLIGLLFTLKTHSRQIYDSRRPESHLLDYAGPSPAARRSSMAGERDGNTPVLDQPAAERSGQEGHEAPEWSKLKSSIILLASTILFSLLAELLVDTVNEVAESFHLNKKFLGITLFALVPSFTEFLNAIMFARLGNVALSLEIGSAYVVQIALIQIPILVAISSYFSWTNGEPELPENSFTLIFPQWDVYTVFFGVFLLSYTYIEGKSNYFKGSILSLSYVVLILSFYFVAE